MKKKKRLSIFTIIIVVFLSGSLIVLLLMLNQMNKNIEKLTVKFVQIEKEMEMEMTNKKNRELNDFETKNLVEINNIYSTYDSNFLKHATAINAPLFRIPDVTSEKVGIVNDTVLIYNTYLVKDNMRNTERWVYVEYVGEDSEEMTTDDCGYMLFSDLTLLDYTQEIYSEVGIGGIYIGHRYEDLIARFGLADDLIKDDYKEWYTYHLQYYLASYINPRTLCVDRLVLEKPSTHDLAINDDLSSQTKWDEYIRYFDRESIEYVIIDLGETQTLEAYFNEEVKLIVNHWKDEAQINSIEIVKM